MKDNIESNKYPVLTPTQMSDLDNFLIKNVNIPSKLLMENAASSSANFISSILQSKSKVLVICGTGNNGGDGFALIRHLINDFRTDYTVIGDKNKFSKDAKSNYEILQSLNLMENELENCNLNEYDCIIDSIFGIGFKAPIRKDLSNLIKEVNSLDKLKISIDIPTGLNSLNGIAEENTFKADYTLTMYAVKTGLLLNDGKDYCGKVEVMNLGMPNNVIEDYSSSYLFKELLPVKRMNNTSKFDYGKCFILAGSENMSGAGCLTANAAITSGAGLVYLCSTMFNPNLLPEIITFKVDKLDQDLLLDEKIKNCIEKCDSIIIGPGLGTEVETIELVNKIVEQFKNKNIIVDADGIKAIKSNNKYSKNITITPHIGEFAELLGKNRKDLYSELPTIVIKTAKKMNLNILLKGPSSIISDGEETYFVSAGTPHLASAGSGDVLSGILGSQINLFTSKSKIETIANSTLTHIIAVKSVLKEKSKIIASDIIQGLQCIE